MLISKTLTISATAALLSGCATTLDVRSDSAQAAYAEGVAQVLPFTQYEVTASWRLVRCDEEADKLALTMSAEAGARDDPAQRYLIDATSLQQALTKSEFGVSYYEGSNTLKSVNADVEDRTVEFAANVVTTLGKVASIAAGVPVVGPGKPDPLTPPAPPPPPPLPTICKPEAQAALAQVAKLKAALDSLNEEVEASTKEVARLIAVADFGPKVDSAGAKKFGAALERQDQLTARQAKLAKQLEAALDDVTATVTIRWPDNGHIFERAEPLTVPEAALSRWFLSWGDPGPRSYLAIRPSAGTVPASAAIPQPGRVTGIPYRLSVQGRLLSCGAPCEDVAPGDRETLVEGTVAQLGGVKVLTVRNPPLASTAFSAEFNRDATLVSAGFKQRSAPGEAASAIAAGAAEKLAAAVDPTEKLKRETAYLKALEERRAAAEAATPDTPDATAQAKAALEANTTLLTAEISNLNAKITRDELLARIAARDLELARAGQP